MLRTFSFGGGRQSNAALVLAAQDRINFPIFLFADVGHDSENPATIEYVQKYSIPFAEKYGIEFHTVRRILYRDKRNGKRKKGEPETLYQLATELDNRQMPLPVFFSKGGFGRRNCTSEYKIDQIAKWQKCGATRTNPCVTGLGISYDELTRMRTSSSIEWQTLEYPLVDLRLTSNDCIDIVHDAGLPTPPRSSCWFCPYKSNGEWVEMAKNNPELFNRAVEIEKRLTYKRRNILGRDEDVFLSYRRIPLTEVVKLADNGESDICESGYCFA